eukprot:TRINITY_DN17495_c0_g1_i1.p1 TRINITY_DN17495_c0_g1~~TRINITY_DN17495_c0_g1_i1.p1  ORF type:complete len:290 (-),score=79.46 TRINITY_DN17495_c0_g1_i1:166-1035(-)
MSLLGHDDENSRIVSHLEVEVHKKDPEQETIPDMVKFALCPTWKFLSFTTVMTVVLWLIHILCAIFLRLSTGDFLDVNREDLYKVGSGYSYSLKYKNHYYRAFTGAFLHSNYQHITSNSIGLVIAGSFLEHFLGWQGVATIYFLSIPISEFASSSTTSSVSIGASGAIFGLMGGVCALYFLRNESLRKLPFFRVRMGLVFLVAIVSQIPVFVAGVLKTSNVNFAAHYGGFIGGFLATFLVTQPTDAESWKEKRGLIVLTGALLWVIALVFEIVVFVGWAEPVDFLDLHA